MAYPDNLYTDQWSVTSFEISEQKILHKILPTTLKVETFRTYEQQYKFKTTHGCPKQTQLKA